jgi:lipopolysaccharide export system protein LptA
MDNNVVLDWRGNTPDALPMHIESGQAWYFENDSTVMLSPWAKMTREALRMESTFAAIILKEGAIEHIDMQNGKGSQDNGSRKVDFNAADMHLLFDEHMTITSVQAQRDTRLVSTAATTKTTVTGDRMDLAFTPVNKESVLNNVVSTGNSVVQAEPIVKPGMQPGDTRVLKSEVVRLAMRPGGEEIDRVETDGPGTLDFLPNRPEQPKRNLKGDRIWINYGAENRIDRFRSVNVTTRTELPQRPPRITSSKEILATFDNTGSLARLEQTTDFKYEEGDRRANARKATLEQEKDLMTLEGSATTYDPTGKVNAERITLNQKTGDYTADGNVSTVRQPSKDPKSGANSAMLDSKEPMQATAKSMASTKGGQRVHYEGDAKAWQGANRVNASILDIDQETHVMEAHGKVDTQFVDKSSDDKAGKAKSGPAAFTTVRASDLVYNTETRLAHYTGGVHLERPGLTVDSHELRAFLNDSNADSSLDKAIADGAVKIFSVSTEKNGKGKRTRTGTAEHGEYYANEQMMILSGGRPTVTDSTKRTSSAKKLTWWANDDRLLEEADESAPVVTSLPKSTPTTASKK